MARTRDGDVSWRPGMASYRCVYCARRFDRRDLLPAHEAECAR